MSVSSARTWSFRMKPITRWRELDRYPSWINANDRRPLAKSLPNVGNIALTESSARMSYNSLQVSARHRLSGGLEMTGFYVWSKSMMETSATTAAAPSTRKALTGRMPTTGSATAVRRASTRSTTLRFGGLYNLPFGKGQKFGIQLEQSRRPDPGRLEREFLHQHALRFPGDRVCERGEQRRQYASRQPARQCLPAIRDHHLRLWTPSSVR